MRRHVAMAVPMFLACCTTQVKEIGFGPGDVRATSFEFNRVEFKVGRPLVGDLLVDSLRAPASGQVRLLKENSDALKETQGLGAEVIGFADEKECLESACTDLSMRRARYVYDWLVEQGVSRSRLKGPASGGAD